MQESTNFKITSTPLELSQREVSESNDSGYHSNVSCINSSRNSTILLSQTRSFSHSVTTPDNFLCVEPHWKSNELYGITRQSPCHRNYFDHFLTGREYVDFFFHLGEKGGYSLIIRKVLSFLNDEDLYNAAAVSKTWKNVIMSIREERKRLKHYSKEKEITKENRVINSTECEICEEKKFESPRSTLMQIQNLRREFSLSNSPVTSVSPPVVHNNYRFEAYQKEGLKVKIGRRLFSCPKCKLPSHVDQAIPNTAECTNSGCRYRFCILCHCEEHKTKMCDFISTPVIRKQTGSVGTSKSKKNLKRLLL